MNVLSHRPPARCTLLVALMLLASLLAGCSNPTITASKEVPADFSLTLFTTTTTQRVTYFEITRASELRYDGGMSATGREGKPVVTLNATQRQEIWDILMNGKLHEAPAGPLFPKAKSVYYDFTFNTGGLDHIVRAIDDEQPALKTLHDYLFKIQAAVRFSDPVLTP